MAASKSRDCCCSTTTHCFQPDRNDLIHKRAGGKVLLKQQRLNKWTTPFESRSYELIDKCGNSVLIESPEGTQYKRITTHVKLYLEREKHLSGSLREEQPVPQEMEAGDVPTNQRDEGRGEEDNLKLREKKKGLNSLAIWN